MKRKLKDAIESLRAGASESLDWGDGLNSKSWSLQVGVLLTPGEAKSILEYIDEKEKAPQ